MTEMCIATRRNLPPRKNVWIDGVLEQYSHYVWFLNTGHWPVSGEDIHHIDGDRSNDEFSNLALMTHSEHSHMHNIGKPKSPEHRAKLSKANRGEKSHRWKGDDASIESKDRRHRRNPDLYPPLTEGERAEYRAYYKERYRKRKAGTLSFTEGERFT